MRKMFKIILFVSISLIMGCAIQRIDISGTGNETIISAKAISPEAIELNCKLRYGAEDYYIYRSENDSTNFKLIDSNSNDAYTNHGLNPATSYYYYVVSRDNNHSILDTSNIASDKTFFIQVSSLEEIMPDNYLLIGYSRKDNSKNLFSSCAWYDINNGVLRDSCLQGMNFLGTYVGGDGFLICGWAYDPANRAFGGLLVKLPRPSSPTNFSVSDISLYKIYNYDTDTSMEPIVNFRYVQELTNSNIILCGNIEYFCDNTICPGFGIIYKTNRSGDILWKRYDSTISTEYYQIVPARDKGFLAVGYHKEGGSRSGLIVKIGENGELINSKLMADCNINALCIAPSGANLAIGDSCGAAFVQQFDDMLNTLQDKRRLENGYPSSALVTNDCNFVVCGNSTKDSSISGWVQKYSINGDLIWKSPLYNNIIFTKIIQTKDDGYTIAGTLFPNGYYSGIQNFQSQGLLIKISSDGTSCDTFEIKK
jgi:hypothetical protein